MEMSNNKEPQSRFFAYHPNYDYIPETDRYLYDLGEPKYKFNVIGAGAIGNEHIRVTMAEGRGTIYGVYDPGQYRDGEKILEVFCT
jgi:myo-inositol 2-dehydrogenase/D-chiro-inositol 1-dehydrogenase